MLVRRYFALGIAVCMLAMGNRIGAEEKPAGAVAGWFLSVNSFGPIKIGMTLDDAEKILKFFLNPDRDVYPGECHYVINKKRLPGLLFMLVGGKIVRIDVTAEHYQTDVGARVGMTEEQIKKLYPEGEVSPDPYRPGGQRVSVYDKNKQYGMIFSTEGNVVKSFRIGQYNEVRWIESCE